MSDEDLGGMWQCQISKCGYIYDPAKGDRKGKIPPGMRFEDLPDDGKCPSCEAGKKIERSMTRPHRCKDTGIVHCAAGGTLRTVHHWLACQHAKPPAGQTVKAESHDYRRKT